MQDSFVFYRSFYEALQDLPPEEYKETFNAIMGYALNDDLPDLAGIPKMAFELIKPQLDANIERRINGLKGGRPKVKKPMVFENAENEKPMVSKNAQNKKPNVNVNVNVNDNVNANANENGNVNANGNENGNGNAKGNAKAFQQIKDLFNDTCVSFPKVTALSDARKKAIKARLNTYTVDDFALLFIKAEESDFLKGKNSRNWSATFDWLIKDSNMVKVLDGNYDNKGKQQSGGMDDFYAMVSDWARGEGA